jgi:pyruvate dehydrogenase E2 component (dihydrolipoamide acetyltransferase)
MVREVHVPDIGDYAEVDVIEVAVKEGDVVAFEDTLITLETEKATMDIPSPFSGVITKMHVAVGDKVSKGSLMLSLDVKDHQEVAANQDMVFSNAITTEAFGMAFTNKTVISSRGPTTAITAEVTTGATEPKLKPVPQLLTEHKDVDAGPGVRRFARELGVDLSKVVGTGRKGRILKHDVQNYVKQALQNNVGGNQGLGLELPPIPKVDFQKFGEIEQKPLARIKKISGAYLHRNWVHIPHVTQFEQADVTALDQLRKDQKNSAVQHGVKLTPLVFIMKAVVAGLQEFPQFNSSLDAKGENLILKKYFHIGVAVDTPNGLMVPVVRETNQKDVFQLAKELGELSKKARDGKLTAAEMQGGCFSISSLGGIGGTAFTPIINAPEVAILGVSKASMQPVFIDGQFQPRMLMPLSLSYDHRVIDGAEAARFANFIVQKLATPKDLLK